MKDNPQVNYEVLLFGEIIVNDCIIIEKSRNIVLLSIDCKSKYYDISCIMQHEDVPGISLCAIPRTLNTDTERKGASTTLLFPEFKGFRVFATNCSKYTTSICLLKETKRK